MEVLRKHSVALPFVKTHSARGYACITTDMGHKGMEGEGRRMGL